MTDQFVITHPEVIRCDLKLAEDDVAIEQAIIETMRAAIEMNAALWERWRQRAEACQERAKVLPPERAKAAGAPSIIFFCEASLVHHQLELGRLRQSVTQRYTDCFASMERALATMRDTGETQILDRERYKEFEKARTLYMQSHDRFLREFEAFLVQHGPKTHFQPPGSPPTHESGEDGG